MRDGWVYIITNGQTEFSIPASRATFLVAFGSIARVFVSSFSRPYGLKRLVWCEFHETILGAIQREKNMKHWPRAWKVRLIHSMNPDWDDLYETLI